MKPLYKTDPEFMERWDAFAKKEVIRKKRDALYDCIFCIFYINMNLFF